jgi:chromosome segregation ATPase
MALTPEQVKIVNLESIVDGLTRKLSETEGDFKSLQVAHSLKGQKIVTLEAEIVRLRMLRTDEQLRGEVDGLREQVSKKDREIARLQKEAARLVEGERAAVVRAQQAEQRTTHFQATLETMQHARDERRRPATGCADLQRASRRTRTSWSRRRRS